MRPIVRIVAHRPNNTPHPRDRALAPERADTPGMGLCRHQDDGRPALAFERLGNGVHFRCRVRAIRLENADGIRRHAEMDQHALAIERFAHVGNPHRSEFRAGTRRPRHPNLRRPTLAIERRGFPRPHRHSAAENHDRISFPKWIFHDKPSANAQRAREYEKHESQENRNPKPRPDARVELLDGQIIDMSPIGPFHGSITKHLNQLFSAASRGRWITQVQDPVRLDEHSEPEPDLALLKPSPDFYRKRHPQPADVFLLIEISDTTLDLDQDEKIPAYGRAGIAEVWIVNLADLTIEIHREPNFTGYGSKTILHPGDEAIPQAFRDVSVDVAELLKR